MTPPGGANPVNTPVIIHIGADGKLGGAGGGPQNGVSVTLDERDKNGYILIAAGGNGESGQFLVNSRSDGGNASASGGNECLVVALGGNGGSATGNQGCDGGNGGESTATGSHNNNDLYSDAGTGGDGGTGVTGLGGSWGHGLTKWLTVPPIPGGKGGLGGAGGDGGRAIISGGDQSYALATGGTGGKGGAGGAGGPGTVPPPPKSLIAAKPAPAGAKGQDRTSGGGGNIKTKLGTGSVLDPASSPGAAGPPATPTGTAIGTAGAVEP